MKKMTKKAFFEIAVKAIEETGSVVIYFKSPGMLGLEYMRKRKIRANGDCFVSYLDRNSKWCKYAMSCFVVDVRSKNVDDSIKRLRRHDGTKIQPLMLEYGKGQNMRRIEYEKNNGT